MTYSTKLTQAKTVSRDSCTNRVSVMPCGEGLASWDEITSFLCGAEIAYDEEQLKKDFASADLNGDNQLDKQVCVCVCVCVPIS